MKTLDGNEAAASIAYRVNEICAIYPITPSSTMGELADQWASEGRRNIWGTVPHVIEMQSEGGAAGAVHGALQTGAMTATFTASQGLLLMIPNMFKIAGELTPTVFHVAARSLAAQALSIFGDHSDVMAARMTGWAMLCSSSVQEAHDLALIAQNATLAGRIPFMHFFDGFRTSHEVSKIEMLDDADVRAMIDDDLVFAHRRRALSPDRPVVRGVAQNPDVYFQGRETVNPYYAALPGHVQSCNGPVRGPHRATVHVVRLLRRARCGSRARDDGVRSRNGARSHRVPERPRRQARTGAGAPVPALFSRRSPGAHSADRPVNRRPRSHEGARRGGRAAVSGRDDGIRRGSRDRPACLDAPDRRWTLRTLVEGVHAGDGQGGLRQPGWRRRRRITSPWGSTTTCPHTSLEYDPTFVSEGEDVVGCVFYGLGADGTVGANKNSIKIIGEETSGYAQGFFVYDSKKSGSRTTSHLRFGPRPIRSTYLVQRAQFVACHQFQFVNQLEMLREAVDGAVFLLNSPFGPDRIWDELPASMQAELIRKRIRLYVIDADAVAADAGMAGRINTIMQTCFFAISGVLPREEAIAKIKAAIQATYGRKGSDLVEQNFAAVDRALEHLFEVPLPSTVEQQPPAPARRAAGGAGVRQAGDRDDDGGARRRTAGQRVAGRRNLPVGHDALGEAQHFGHGAGVAAGDLHPVRQLRDGLSALGHPGSLLRRVAVGGGAGGICVRAAGRPRLPESALHTAGGGRRLHRLRAVR